MRGKWMGLQHRKAIQFLMVAAWIVAIASAWAPIGQAKPNPFEQKRIETEAQEAFRVIIQLWRQELYFELYDLGSESTQARIPREEFAQRMVELPFVPLGDLNPKYLKSKLRYRSMVYVEARVDYRHKFNTSRTFHRDHSFLLLKEGKSWRVDLVQLIRAPYTR